MTDLTPALSAILVKQHSSRPIRGEDKADVTAVLDSFLKEAYQINRSISSLLDYLRAIRTPYLSNAAAPRQNKRHSLGNLVTTAAGNGQDIPAFLSDSQREAIDSQTSSILREINSNITNLSSAVTLQHDTATKIIETKYGKPSGALWRWAAGDGDDPDAGKPDKQIEEEGQARTIKSFRDGVLWYLSHRLNAAITLQQDMVERRLEREQEKQKSILYNQRNKGVRPSWEVEEASSGTGPHGSQDLRGHDEYNPALDRSAGGDQQALSPEQLQLFEEENKGIFEHFNDQLAKVTQVEKSLVEIGSLQQTLVGHLSVQGEMIGQLVEDAANTDENVRKGNRELKKASERGSTAMLVFYATCGLCSFLVVWDLIF